MVTMYDDVRVDLIPAKAPAVAYYVNGRYANGTAVKAKFPNVPKLSIAVTSHADADCLDVEPGDATNEVAAAWVKRQVLRGVKRPALYTSVSNVRPLLAALRAAGIYRGQVRLWTAHYTGKPHLCGSACGFGLNTTADATQWTDRALGRSLDQSLCLDSFFGLPAKPPPKPTLKENIGQFWNAFGFKWWGA